MNTFDKADKDEKNLTINQKNKENEPILVEFLDKNCHCSMLFHLLCMQ